MPNPVTPVRLDSGEWRAHIDTLRRGREVEPAAYLHSEQQLMLGMTDAAGCLTSYARTLGQAAFDDAVADAIVGTATRKGLLEELRVSAEPVEFPKTWFLKSLGNRLKDAVRRLHRERDYADETRARRAPTLRARGSAEDSDDEEPGEASGGIAPDVDPTVVPAEVQKTFADVSGFGAVLLTLCDQLPDGHALARPPAETRQAWRKSITHWHETAQHLGRDVGLGTKRLRWPGNTTGPDNHARAWQVRYYASVGETDYFDAQELPEDKRSPEGALSYQHLRRFRATYAECAGFGGDVVGELANQPLQPSPGTRRRPLPVVWEPARHPTLVLERK